MLSRYIRSWGGYKLHIGSNLPPKDNLRKEDKSSAPKVSFIRRFHCSTTVVPLQHCTNSHLTGVVYEPCFIARHGGIHHLIWINTEHVASNTLDRWIISYIPHKYGHHTCTENKTHTLLSYSFSRLSVSTERITVPAYSITISPGSISLTQYRPRPWMPDWNTPTWFLYVFWRFRYRMAIGRSSADCILG